MDGMLKRPAASAVIPKDHGCTFLTNHAHILLSIARDPEIRLRDLAIADINGRLDLGQHAPTDNEVNAAKNDQQPEHLR